MLWNCYFDLTDGVKIQESAVMEYPHTPLWNTGMEYAVMEYPFSHSLLRNLFMSEIEVFMDEVQV